MTDDDFLPPTPVDPEVVALMDRMIARVDASVRRHMPNILLLACAPDPVLTPDPHYSRVGEQYAIGKWWTAFCGMWRFVGQVHAARSVWAERTDTAWSMFCEAWRLIGIDRAFQVMCDRSGDLMTRIALGMSVPYSAAAYITGAP